MRFPKFISAGLCTGFLALGIAQSQATYIIEFVPANQTVNLGSTAIVDIFIEDTGADSPAVGAYIFDVQFDPSIVSIGSSDVTFGTDMGTSVNNADDSNAGAGSITLDEVSLESSADLTALQPDRFLVATLEFSADAVGLSPLSFALTLDQAGVPHCAFSDPTGLVDLTGEFSLGDGSIRVIDGPGNDVPDGGDAVLLFLPALGLLFGLRRKLKRC